MKCVSCAGALALVPALVFAQAPGSTSDRSQPSHPATPDTPLATRTGHEVEVGVSRYNYVEPGSLRISLHGPKISGAYALTLSLDQQRRWFGRGDVRASLGHVTYDGWCLPFVITPNTTSPNGYELGLGEASPCGEQGDRDWYVEGRALVGRDFIGDTWALSPEAGLGFRHLSNGTTGTPGYRTDDYLYVPIGVTARTLVASHHVLRVTLEYDQLIRGWQTTRDSRLETGAVAATATAPAFTIDSFTDISFAQHRGWALRAGARYEITRRWSVAPYYIYWRVGASPVSAETVAFTVNGVTAHEQFGAYEPVNFTREFGVNIGLHF